MAYDALAATPGVQHVTRCYIRRGDGGTPREEIGSVAGEADASATAKAIRHAAARGRAREAAGSKKYGEMEKRNVTAAALYAAYTRGYGTQRATPQWHVLKGGCEKGRAACRARARAAALRPVQRCCCAAARSGSVAQAACSTAAR